MGVQQVYQIERVSRELPKVEQVVKADVYLVSALRPQHNHEGVTRLKFVGDILPIVVVYVAILVFVFFYGGFSGF